MQRDDFGGPGPSARMMARSRCMSGKTMRRPSGDHDGFAPRGNAARPRVGQGDDEDDGEACRPTLEDDVSGSNPNCTAMTTLSVRVGLPMSRRARHSAADHISPSARTSP
jgi:hypothetical protein